MMQASNRVLIATCMYLTVCLGVTLAVRVHGGEEEEVDPDVITRTDGRPAVSTKIKKDDYISVEGQLKNLAKVKVPSYLVESVQYGDWDSRFATGVEKLESGGNPKTCAKLFRKAMEAMRGNKRAQEYCNYYIGYSFLKAKIFNGYKDRDNHTYDHASKYFARVISLNPKSRFLLDALVKKAVCLGEEGKMAEADAAFKVAESGIKAYRNDVMQYDTGYLKLADRARALAKYADAVLKEKKEDGKADANSRNYQKALSAFKSAQSKSSSSDKEIYGLSVDGELRVLLKMKSYAAAKDRAEAIIAKFKKKADPALYGMLPGAHIVMGLANYKKASDYLKKDQELQADNKFAEARWNFLNVIVQFFENGEYVTKAHYFAGLCYEQLKDKEKGGINRARDHWSIIIKDYPKSKFVSFAEKKLADYPAAVQGAGEEKKEETPNKKDK